VPKTTILFIKVLLGYVTTISTVSSTIYGLAVTLDGRIYAAELTTVSKYTIAGSMDNCCVDIIAQPCQAVCFAGTRVVLAGNEVEGYADGSGTSAKFEYSYDVAFVTTENLYVADIYNYVIRRVTTDGLNLFEADDATVAEMLLVDRCGFNLCRISWSSGKCGRVAYFRPFL
jgi:hypothetical protein